MKTIQIKTLLVAMVCVVAMSNVFAQQPDSLVQYLDIATKNNPLIQQRFSEYKAALQKVPQVGSLADPELSVGLFLSPMELLSGKQVADIQLMQMFPWFGVLKNAKDEMGLMAKAKYESFRDAQLQVAFELKSTWYELQKNQQAIRIAEQNLDVLRTLESLALIKFKSGPQGATATSASNPTMPAGTASTTAGMNGMGGNAGSSQPSPTATPSPTMPSNAMGGQSGGSGLADVYRIQLEKAELDNSIALLKSQQTTLVAKFNAYLNRLPQTDVALPDSMATETLFVPLPAVADSMLAHNPMLAMLKYEGESLGARKKMVTQMGYPMVGVGLNYSLITKSDMSTSAMNGKDMVMPMVTVTLPIYRRKYKAMQAEADWMMTANQQGSQATANGLQTDYYSAVQLFRDAERRMALYQNQHSLASKSLSIMVKSFSASGAGLTDVLTIRRQLLDYDTRLVEAQADYNTSVAWLKRLMASSSNQ